jgi:ubiquinone/menaquinone biosynthesis C-methylase UbiE
MPDPRKPHSDHQFGPQRDFWWNPDFLDLMATRWRLGEASSLADIGSGLCHWSRLLYGYLKQPARLACIDREPRWVSEAPSRFRAAFPGVSPELLTFAEGDATDIPLPDNSFDVATCQTVLMHLARPIDALREMIRILRPGGLLICVEPNNLWNIMSFTSLTPTEPVEELVRRFEFWVRYHRGKRTAGDGDHQVGDLLPGWFAQLGLTELSVYRSDRAISYYPPYETAAQKTLIEQERQWKKTATGPWDRDELKRNVLRGGWSEEAFDRVFAEIENRFALEHQAIGAGEFHAGFGSNTYLVSGRKPGK